MNIKITPKTSRTEFDQGDGIDVCVAFEHPKAVQAILEHHMMKTNNFNLIYTVEISPPTALSPQVTSILFQVWSLLSFR